MEYGSIRIKRFVSDLWGKRGMTAFFIDKGRIVERRHYEKRQVLFYSCCRLFDGIWPEHKCSG